MSDTVLGTCSLCGGAVVLPSMMVNPVPCCRSCGATPERPHGPVMPMVRPSKPKSLETLQREMRNGFIK